MQTKLSTLAMVVVVGALLLSSCSLSGDDELAEPVPIAELTQQALTASPAEWSDDVPDDWPTLVPAPSFLEDLSPSVVRPGEAFTIESTSRPDDAAVMSHIALLLDVGFSPDPQAAEDGWFVRDGFEWVALQNRDLTEFLRDGASIDNAKSFIVVWTTDPVPYGYCRVVESGGATCRN